MSNSIRDKNKNITKENMARNIETSTLVETVDQKGTETKQYLVPKGVDDNIFSLSDLYAPNSKYPPEQKMQAVMAYILTNSSLQAEKLSGVTAATIRWWKNEADWWHDAVVVCRKEKNDEVDAKITEIIDKSLEKVKRTLEEGEDYVHPKTGEILKKQASLRDMATSLAILFDKRQIIRGEPTSLASTADHNEIINNLMQKFEDLSKEMKEHKNMRVVN